MREDRGRGKEGRGREGKRGGRREGKGKKRGEGERERERERGGGEISPTFQYSRGNTSSQQLHW